jgi:hypothetical protein
MIKIDICFGSSIQFPSKETNEKKKVKGAFQTTSVQVKVSLALQIKEENN